MARRSYPTDIIQKSNMVVPLLRESQVISPVLFDYLTCITPHKHEKKIHKFLPFMDDKDLDITIDEVGNIIVKVGKFRGDFRTVFSCHMDTMHYEAQVDTKMELCMTSKANLTEVPKDFKEGLVFARWEWESAVDGHKEYAPMILGADDKVGMYIMTRMIEARVPGMYVFHVGEERGGIGSTHIKDKTPKIFKGMRRAIAFDRMHYGDIINVQGGKTCCSKEFTDALAEQLNKNLPPLQKFKAETGIWTDTANYKYLISECSNISVGYWDQHSTTEHFDAVWLEALLLPAILKVDWESLPSARNKVKAKQDDEKPYTPAWQSNANNTYQVLPYKDITKTTMLYQVPTWKPSEGIPVDCPKVALERMIEKWLLWSNNKANSVDELLGLVKKVAELEGKITAMKNEKEQAAPFRDNSSFNDPAVKKNRLTVKCQLAGKASSLWWREVTMDHIQPLDVHDAKRIDQVGDTAAVLVTQIETIKRDPASTSATLEYQFNRSLFDFVMGAFKYQYCNATFRHSLEDIMRYIAGNLDEPVFADYKQTLTPLPPAKVLTGGDVNKGG